MLKPVLFQWQDKRSPWSPENKEWDLVQWKMTIVTRKLLTCQRRTSIFHFRPIYYYTYIFLYMDHYSLFLIWASMIYEHLWRDILKFIIQLGNQYTTITKVKYLHIMALLQVPSHVFHKKKHYYCHRFTFLLPSLEYKF